MTYHTPPGLDIEGQFSGFTTDELRAIVELDGRFEVFNEIERAVQDRRKRKRTKFAYKPRVKKISPAREARPFVVRLDCIGTGIPDSRHETERRALLHVVQFLVLEERFKRRTEAVAACIQPSQANFCERPAPTAAELAAAIPVDR